VAQLDYLGRPTSLFRYRPYSKLEREIDTLEQNYIYCPNYASLNDPMEGKFRQGSKLGLHSPTYVEAIQTTLGELGLASFCEVQNHVLMWAHYADQYKGLCISYNFTNLLAQLPEAAVFTRIAYSETQYQIRTAKRQPIDVAKRILSRKTRSWIYEREWRLFHSVGRASYQNKGCVNFVILGSRMPESDKAQTRAKLEALGIETRSLDEDRLIMSI
jgi:hypothetical protein